MAKHQEDNIRVLLFPFLAHGHASVFLELAKRLVKRNFYVYFCSTPATLNSIQSKIPKGQIEVVEFHLSSSPELPPQYHTLNRLPPHLLSTLVHVTNQSSSSLHHVLSTISPDFFIHDILPSWAASLANSLGILSAVFYTFNASVIAFTLFPEKCSQDYPFASNILQHFSPFIVHRFALIKTCRDVEGKYLDMIQDNSKVIIPVGCLVEEPDSNEDEESEILQWLDDREPSSSVLVSFGSQFYLSKEQIHEIAMGLEMAEVSFVWVLRFHHADNIGVEDALPIGFLSRIGEARGKILEWAPQTKILNHRSIGGFVSHCGWASVMESMKFGVPIIAVPMENDQPLNSKLVENAGVGIEVKRGEAGRIISEEVARTIRMAVVEKTRERIREKAAEMSLRLKSNEDMEMDNVVKEIRNLWFLSRHNPQ